MNKTFRSPALLVLWIALSLSVTFLMSVLLFGWAFVKAQFMPWLLLTSLFIIVAFLIYRTLWAKLSINGTFADVIKANTLPPMPKKEEKPKDKPKKK